MSHENDDATAVRQMLAPLETVDVDDLRAERIRREAQGALAARDAGWLASGRRAWRRAEPVLAFAVATIYMGLAFREMLQIY